MASNLKLGSNWKACGYLYDMRRWDHGNSRVNIGFVELFIQTFFSPPDQLWVLQGRRQLWRREEEGARRLLEESGQVLQPGSLQDAGSSIVSKHIVLIDHLVGHRELEVSSAREAAQGGEEQGCPARGEGEGGGGEDGEEQEVETEEGDALLLLHHLHLVLLEGAGGQSGGGREAVQEKRAVRKASR